MAERDMDQTNAPKISFDKDSAILSIRLSSKKSVDSDVKGHVVLDYDKNGDLVNVDIMEVSLNEFKRIPAFRHLARQVRLAA